MNWIAILIICVAMAAVIGPVLIMKPSKRQKNLANLRAKAATLGLRVQMAKFKDGTIAVYEKPWPLTEKVKKRIQPWRVDKMPYVHDIHIAEYWNLTGEAELNADLKLKLPALFAKLPEGVLAVEVTRLGARCYWNERGGEQALQVLADWLEDFIQFMIPYIPPPSVD